MENIQTQINHLDTFKDQLITFATAAGSKIIVALLIYIVGRLIIGKLLKLFDKMGSVSKMDPTARGYLRTVLKAALYIVLVVSIIAELGVPMASVITVIASAGVAVGLALQGALGNLAGGIMLLIFRPFNRGDYVCAGGEEGVVKNISLFYTVLTTVDNKTVSIPNGAMMNSNITNLTAEDMRRVDLTFNIAGSEPIKKVQAAIMNVIINTEKALADPAPDVQPVAGIPGGLEYTVRVWARTEDYWDVYFELMREIPTALGQNNISGPSTPISVSSK